MYIVQQEKLQKAAMKAEAAELRKLEKEKKKWGKGKFALKSIVAEIDTKVVELGSVGGKSFLRLLVRSEVDYSCYCHLVWILC